MIRLNMPEGAPNEAAGLARTILHSLDGESDAETVKALVADLRLLANAVIHVAELADRLDRLADHEASRGHAWDAACIRSEAARVRTALKGDAA